MDVVGLISGGKDSIYNLLLSKQLGHSLLCLANLHPGPAKPYGDSLLVAGDAGVPQELDSFMFQTVGHTAIESVAQCMGLPLVRRVTSGASSQRGMHYYSQKSEAPAVDEVEDLYELLSDVKSRFPSVRGVAVGAILSNYQRLRVEDVCARLGLIPIAMLWQRSQPGLLRDMVDAGLESVLVKVASYGLTPRMLGKTLAELQPALHAAGSRFGLNVCGEGGEYETMTLHCPALFRHGRVRVDSAQVVRQSADVAHWHITECSVQPPETGAGECGDSGSPRSAFVAPPPPLDSAGTRAGCLAVSDEEASAAAAALAGLSEVPFSVSGRYVHVGGLTAYSPAVRALAPMDATVEGLPAAQRAVAELHAVMGALASLLASSGCALSDVCFVHLYLSDMGLFGPVNGAYCEFFGDHPPSRSCVAVKLAPVQLDEGSGRTVQPTVLLDCVALRGSGAALRAPGDAASAHGGSVPKRSTLHVQSLSSWAPLCIGPYCQANVVGGLVLAAGSIALMPESMQLAAPLAPGMSAAAAHYACLLQTHQALLNVARVLSALDSGLPLATSVTVYVAASALQAAAGGVDDGHAHKEGTALLPSIRAMVGAWMCGAFGRSSPIIMSRLATDDGYSDADDRGSDGTYSPPCSEDGDVSGADIEPTSIACDPCRERDYSLGASAHIAPPYLRAKELQTAVKEAAELPVPESLAGESRYGLALPSLPASVLDRLPLRLVVVPSLPRGAAAEVEVMAAQAHSLAASPDDGDDATRTVDEDGSASKLQLQAWRAEERSGDGFVVAAATTYRPGVSASVFVELRSDGDNCAAGTDLHAASSRALLHDAVRAGLRGIVHAGLPTHAALHVRAYVRGHNADAGAALQAAVSREAGAGGPARPPQLTVVPVSDASPCALLLHLVALA